MPLFQQTSLGGGAGRLKHEALREEVHCFDGNDHTPIIGISKAQCCSAAMQEEHVGNAGCKARTGQPPASGAGYKNARVMSGRRVVSGRL